MGENQNFASEILGELKTATKRLWILVGALLAIIVTMAVAFVWYINQWDYTETIEATGVYALVDSSGNVFAQDVDPETWDKFLEWSERNSNSQTDETQNP